MVSQEKKSLSQEFEEVHKDFTTLSYGQESTASSIFQDKIEKTISRLEELTRNVSAVDMFSKNESFDELDAHELKFLLLPYMLGALWQLNTREDRKHLCEMSQIYFLDFLKRCKEYDFIQAPDVEEDEEGVKPKPKSLTPAEKRDLKIRKLKQNQELDAKIEAFQRWTEKFEDSDTVHIKEIYVALVKKAINDTEDQLESITMELKLIKFGEKSREGGGNERESPPRRRPLKPFIITKDEKQKEVFGLGYPSLPVMTVEELYQQRIANGEWGPPPAGGNIPNPEQNPEEEDDIRKELLELQDNEVELNRQRNYDEYKDDHRRGWGNRFNRS